MPILSRARLRAELHCLSTDGLVVITGQQWFDPQAPQERPVSWLRLVRNGQVERDSRVAGVEAQFAMQEFWIERAAVMAATRLEEEQMWVKLGELAKIRQTECVRTDCAGRMPVAWWFCPACGCDARKVASGSLSGVRRSGELFLDLRKRS